MLITFLPSNYVQQGGTAINLGRASVRTDFIARTTQASQSPALTLKT